jgi:hypothetical protein
MRAINKINFFFRKSVYEVRISIHHNISRIGNSTLILGVILFLFSSTSPS